MTKEKFNPNYPITTVIMVLIILGLSYLVYLILVGDLDTLDIRDWLMGLWGAK